MSFLNEIQKNAGEAEKSIVESEIKRGGLQRKILLNTGMEDLMEMAQQHFDNEIIDFILAGEYDEAADRYIANQAAKGYKIPVKADATVKKVKEGEYAKGFGADKDKTSKVTEEQWQSFLSSYREVASKDVGERKRKKIKGVEDASGDVRTSVSPTANARKLRSKTTKLRDEVIQKMMNAETEEEREDHESHAEALNSLLKAIEFTIAGKATLPPKTKEEVDKLKERYKKIGLKYKKPISGDEDGDGYATDAERERALEDLQRRRRERYRDVDEVVSLKGKILAESYNYYGNNFWKNYIMTSVMKGFAKDYKTLGEGTKYIYSDIFGIETISIFEHMENNINTLNEVVKTNAPLLFEEQGYNAIMEAGPSILAGGAPEKVGFLKGLWNKIKTFGAPIVSRLSGLVGAGVTWAKKIAEKGIGWIATNPIAQVAVPAVVLAGSAIGAIALVNKIRKKSGESKLSKAERQELKRVAVEDSREIERQTKKMGKVKKGKPMGPRDEMDDEEDLVSDEEL